MRPPENVSELRTVLGLLGYYRCYVPNFSTVAEPMNKLLSKKVEFKWESEQQASFETIKEILCTDGRAMRRVNPDLPLLVYTDFSNHGIGAILAQTGRMEMNICALLSAGRSIFMRNSTRPIKEKC